ncbi:MAG: TIGR00282 family metallophosphoesterase [Armatimonadetes bacterium]|nr:TIGR00282 family metallophosphoesterase [Armatimonadota bacterium]
MRLLFIGDIVGRPGREAVSQLLPALREEYSPDFIVANGENAAGGMGITKETAAEVFQSGVDVVTLGNHVWSKKEVYTYLDEEQRLLRPANYPVGAPGRGWNIYLTKSGIRIGVINLCGRIFMENLEDPFRTADAILLEIGQHTNLIFIDFHAEVTSEKSALGWYLDGRVTGVLGTHTHVQTADERILPGGTAFISDVGMTGPIDSVIGVKKELIISRFITQMPTKFEIAEGKAMLSAVLVEADCSTGQALSVTRIQRNQSA